MKTLRLTTDWIRKGTALLVATAFVTAAGAADDPGKARPERQDRQQNAQAGDAAEDRNVQREAADPEATVSKEKQGQREKQEKQARKLQVFELENRKANEIQQLISLHTQATQQQAQLAAQHDPREVAPPGIGQPTGVQRTTGFRGPQQPQLSVAADPEQNLLFVRGSADQLKQVDELVSALDVADDQLEKQSFGELHLIPVRHGKAAQVQQILGQLQLQTQMVAMGEVGLIVVRTDAENGEADQLEQIEEIVSKLEAGKSDAKEKKEEKKETPQEASDDQQENN